MTGQIIGSHPAAPGGSILWGLVLSVHLLAMATWIGGAAYTVLVMRPRLGLLDNTQRNSVQLQCLTRYFRLVWHVMPLVLITGWLMLAFPLGGFNDPDWHVQAMQGIGVAIALLFAGPPTWDPRPAYLAGLLYLSLAATALAFSLYYRIIQTIGPGRAAYSSVLVPVQAMQGIGVVIALLFAYAYFRPLRKVRRAIRPQPADFERVRSLVSTNLYLGVLVVVIASLDHVFY